MEVTVLDKVAVKRNKFELSSEQNFERLWREAQEAGWSFRKFCEHVTCMLVVFERRDKKGRELAEQTREKELEARKSKKKRAIGAR